MPLPQTCPKPCVKFRKQTTKTEAGITQNYLLYCLCDVQTSSGAYLTSYPMGNGVLSCVYWFLKLALVCLNMVILYWNVSKKLEIILEKSIKINKYEEKVKSLFTVKLRQTLVIF